MDQHASRPMTPYIGITGFCSRSEVDAVLAAVTG